MGEEIRGDRGGVSKGRGMVEGRRNRREVKWVGRGFGGWGWGWGNNQVHHMSKCSKIVCGWNLKSPESETWMEARGERGRMRRYVGF